MLLKLETLSASLSSFARADFFGAFTIWSRSRSGFGKLLWSVHSTTRDATSSPNQHRVMAFRSKVPAKSEIVGSQNQTPIGLATMFEEPARGPLLNDVAQSHELIDPLICLDVTSFFQIVHRLSADRTVNDLALIEHGEFNDHSIEVVGLHLSALQWHCNSPRRAFRPGDTTMDGRVRLPNRDTSGPLALMSGHRSGNVNRS